MWFYPHGDDFCYDRVAASLWLNAQLLYACTVYFDVGLFAIGAPGVPGGTVLASLGLIISVLHFDEAGTALLLTIFALQDSFGTACNVTGDGALTLITDTYEKRISNNRSA